MDERAPEQKHTSSSAPEVRSYHHHPKELAAPQQRASPSDKMNLDPDEAAAVAAFYRTNIAALVRFLLSKGIRLVDATEVAQDAMFDVARQWRTIKSPKAWVWRVAAVKAIRRITSIEESPTGNVEAAGALLKLSADEAVHWEEKQEVLRLLRKLPPRQAQVLAWTFDGFKPTEIAEQLRITPEAVRSNLRKARQTLTALVAEASKAEQ